MDSSRLDSQALFKAVPLEGVRLPVWVERPHLLQDAFRPGVKILEITVMSDTGKWTKQRRGVMVGVVEDGWVAYFFVS